MIEIVTEPDLRSAAEAADFFALLRGILVWLGVNDGNMEEGSLRCDANVSIRPAGAAALGTKVEVKNLNSFRFLEKALEYEIVRQADVLDVGGRVAQETRLWDASAGRTVGMRSKEEAHDYRYFPEPDLPPLVVDSARVSEMRTLMPELPDERRRRFIEEYALPEYDATQLTQSRAASDYFEASVRAGAAPKLASNWIMGELARKAKDTRVEFWASVVTPERLAGLIGLIERGTINSSSAKEILDRMYVSGRSAEEIVQDEGFAQIDDHAAIQSLVDQVLKGHADAVAQYRAGKTAALGFLVGQVMKIARGKANPARVNEALHRTLDTAPKG